MLGQMFHLQFTCEERITFLKNGYFSRNFPRICTPEFKGHSVSYNQKKINDSIHRQWVQKLKLEIIQCSLRAHGSVLWLVHWACSIFSKSVIECVRFLKKVGYEQDFGTGYKRNANLESLSLCKLDVSVWMVGLWGFVKVTHGLNFLAPDKTEIVDFQNCWVIV